jgi:hypothetical protein
MRCRSRFSSTQAVSRTIVSVLVASSLAGCGGGLKQGAIARGSNPASSAVFLPSATPFGKTYGEWADEWWKWGLGAPSSDNPFLDPTGEKCSAGQSGPVWFLGSTFQAEAERRCVVPADKALFFPVGFAVLTVLPVDAETVAGLRALAKAQADHITELQVAVDGVELQGLRNFRFRSPSSFIFTTVDLLGVLGLSRPGFEDGVPHEAVTDGYWVMLQRLPVGEHTIIARVKFVFPAQFPDVQTAETKLIWHLTVQ